MILLIDNYDSFVHNLARYFQQLGQRTQVVRNDAVAPSDVVAMKPRAIVISPGPCTPAEAGCSLEVVRRCHPDIPILGVCLGHQTIAAAFGAQICRAEPMHGRTSEVYHDGSGIFAGTGVRVPNPLVVCRYHALVVHEPSLPSCLHVSARTSDDVVMALRHKHLPVVGVQFHPESILTAAGYDLLAGFLRVAGLSLPDQIPTTEQEYLGLAGCQPQVPPRPVTF